MDGRVYGITYGLYDLHGYVWDELTGPSASRLLGLFGDEQFAGSEPDLYGFARCRSHDDVFFGDFVQKYALQAPLYDSPMSRHIETVHAFEERFFVFLPKRNLFTLEKKPFVRRTLLTQKMTERRIEGLAKIALGTEAIRLSRYSRDYSQEEIRRFFYGNRAVGLRASGLRGKRVPESVVFFNPDFDKNSVSRDLFNEKILPFIDSVSIDIDYPGTDALPSLDSDLRKNAIAKAVVESAGTISELVVARSEGGKTSIKPHVSDKIQISIETDDQIAVVAEIMKHLNELSGRAINVRILPARQGPLLDGGGSK